MALNTYRLLQPLSTLATTRDTTHTKYWIARSSSTADAQQNVRRKSLKQNQWAKSRPQCSVRSIWKLVLAQATTSACSLSFVSCVRALFSSLFTASRIIDQMRETLSRLGVYLL